MFVERMRTVAERAETVERRHAERGTEVPVRPSAGHPLGNRLTQLRARRLGDRV